MVCDGSHGAERWQSPGELYEVRDIKQQTSKFPILKIYVHILRFLLRKQQVWYAVKNNKNELLSIYL